MRTARRRSSRRGKGPRYLWFRKTLNLINLTSLPTTLAVVDIGAEIGLNSAAPDIEGYEVVMRRIKLQMLWRHQQVTASPGVPVFHRFGVWVGESTGAGNPLSADINWPSPDDVRRDWLDVWTTPTAVVAAAPTELLYNQAYPLPFMTRDIKVARRVTTEQTLNISIAYVPTVSGTAMGTVRMDGRIYLSILFKHTRPI